jgi:hypothetical protein
VRACFSELTSFCAEKDHWQLDRQPAGGSLTIVFVFRDRVSFFYSARFGISTLNIELGTLNKFSTVPKFSLVKSIDSNSLN